MSSIYGILSKNGKIKDINTSFDKILRWNKLYGIECQYEIIGEFAFLGSSVEHISNSYENWPPVLHLQSKYYVVDAIIYNRKELITELNLSNSSSDEQIIVSLIEKKGFDALKMVNGDFSGAVYEPSNNLLVLFRDHMGVRPLFYYEDNDYLVFSTDIRGILALDFVDCTISSKWVYRNMVGNSSLLLDDTEFEMINCITPASYTEFNITNSQVERKTASYWKLGSKKIRHSKETMYMSELRDLIIDAVNIRAEAVQGKIGAELSGGLDSGVIDIILARLKRDTVYYSWTASPEVLPLADRDERLIIEDICKQEGIECLYGGNTLKIGIDSNISNRMKSVGLNVDEKDSFLLRYAFPPYVNTLELSDTSHMISNAGAQVVFTGHGGDEGVSHRMVAYEMLYYHEYYHYFRYLFGLTHGKKYRIIEFAKEIRRNLVNYKKECKTEFHTIEATPHIMNREFRDKMGDIKLQRYAFSYDPIEYIMIGGSRNRLDNIAIQGAYSGVRYLVPYLDYRVIDYAVSIPRYMYLRGRKDRYVFREAFKDMMPESLYKLTLKVSMSASNRKPDPDWYKHRLEQKKLTLDRLDRNLWEKYLDFEELEKWKVAPEPTPENDRADKMVMFNLSKLLMLQNVVEKAKTM